MAVSRFGGCVVSKNIYNKTGKLKWCVREKSIRDVDNGWRFFSDIDTDKYLNDPNNMCICMFETVIEIEPAVLAIYDMPVGTEVTLMQDGKRKFFIDTSTGKEITLHK